LLFDFEWNDTPVDVPKITDVLDPSKGFPPDLFQVFTYAWVWFLGGWFFAILIGGLAAALYEKTDNMIAPVVFLILMLTFFGAVLGATPLNGMPTAAVAVDIIGALAAFAAGFLIYKVFIKKEG